MPSTQICVPCTCEAATNAWATISADLYAIFYKKKNNFFCLFFFSFFSSQIFLKKKNRQRKHAHGQAFRKGIVHWSDICPLGSHLSCFPAVSADPSRQFYAMIDAGVSVSIEPRRADTGSELSLKLARLIGPGFTSRTMLPSMRAHHYQNIFLYG